MAKDCFTRHYADLTRAIAGAGPLQIANALVAKGLVGQHVADGVANAKGEGNYEHATRIMQDISALITVVPKEITSFLEVLDDSEGLACKTEVAKMRKERKEQIRNMTCVLILHSRHVLL